MTKAEKSECLNAIGALLKAFSEEHLNDELASYALNLCERIGRNRNLPVVRGRKEIWAAAIMYVIAHLNFLFDRQQEYSLTPDMICEFFKTKRSTTVNKAREIERACDIAMGEEGLCSQEISDAFTLVELPGGFVATRSMLHGGSVKIGLVDEEEADRGDLVEQFGKLFQQLAAASISHGDLKATNFIVTHNKLIITDLDAMREHKFRCRFRKAFGRDLKRFMQNWADLPELINIFREQLNNIDYRKK